MNLQDAIGRAQRQSLKRILLIPFEDEQIVSILRQSFPEAELTILRKHDLAGIPFSSLLNQVRSDRWDLAVTSLVGATVQRSRTSVELLLASCRARSKWLRTDPQSVALFSFFTALFKLVPRLIVGTAAGTFSLLRTYRYLLFTRTTRRDSTQLFQQRLKQSTSPAILFLRTDLPGPIKAGGSVSHIKGMINAFLQKGFRVIYVADAVLPMLPPEVIQHQIQPSPLLDFFDEFQLIDFNLRVIREGRSLLQQYQPVMVYQRHALFNFSGALLGYSASVPTVLEANASEVWVKKNWSRLFFVQHAQRCETLAIHLAERVAVISTRVQEQITESAGALHHWILNPNGVDPDEFHPALDGTAVRERMNLGDDVVAGFIGTFTRWHGVETLFDAAVSVIQKNDRIRFLLIGDGDLRARLEAQAKQLQIEDRILFTGLIPHHEAPQYLAACDILISPHLGFESGAKFFGSPTKLFEYMAMGKPIIASNLEQIGEIIRDGINGLQMEPGNAQQLAEKILQLSSDPALRHQLAEQARRDVCTEFTWLRNVERIVESLTRHKV